MFFWFLLFSCVCHISLFKTKKTQRTEKTVYIYEWERERVHQSKANHILYSLGRPALAGCSFTRDQNHGHLWALSCLLTNILVVVWWYGKALQLQTCLKWTEPWILLSSRESCMRMSNHQSLIWSSAGLCCKKKRQSARASLVLKGSKETNLKFWRGLVKVLTWTPSTTCAKSLNGQFMHESPLMYLN